MGGGVEGCSEFSENSSDLVVGPFPKYPSPQCPLELQSAGLGCTSLAELEEENVLNLPTNQFLYTTSPHKNSRQACLCQIFQLLCKDRKVRKNREKKNKRKFCCLFCVLQNSHSTIRVILLLTEGGILLLAMQRYAPICSREMS